MFTGIIEECVSVISFETGVLSLDFPLLLLQDLTLGASVACDGVCLTVVEMVNNRVSFNVIDETLSKTTLSQLMPGMKVNVERSLKIGSEVGGHLLSGHVMGMGRIESIEKNIYTISCPPFLSKYLFPKGYVGLDGMSLTLVIVTPETFTIHLIPETLRRTTIGHKKKGESVNIEVDMQTLMIVDTVERYLERNK